MCGCMTHVFPNDQNDELTTNSLSEVSDDQNLEISIVEVRNMILKGAIHLFDVRMPTEIQQEGKIWAGDWMNIPLPEIERAFKLSNLDFYKKYRIAKPIKDDCTVVLYCRSEVRSMKA